MAEWIAKEAEHKFAQVEGYKPSRRDRRNRLRFWLEDKFNTEISKKALQGLRLNIHLPRIVHIVRRFGCVGGMESYVWNLTHELVRLGLQIEIICEETFGQFDPNILIHRIPKSQPKPRWRSMQRFRKLVTQYVNDNFQSHQVLIHSHERSDCHHVTTFHGPPISSKTSFLK